MELMYAYISPVRVLVELRMLTVFFIIKKPPPAAYKNTWQTGDYFLGALFSGGSRPIHA